MTYTLETQYTSKNFTPAAQVPAIFGMPRTITGITIHHWGGLGQLFETVRQWLCTNNVPTSAHYIVQAGLVSCIVAPENAAWHAGTARGNATTIGIECRPEATDEDYATVAELIRDLRATYGDLPLFKHSDWIPTACPGVWDLPRLDALARNQPPTEKDWFDMANLDDLKQAIRETDNEKFSRQGSVGGQMSKQDFFAWFDATMASAVRQAASAAAQAVLNTPIPRIGGGTITLATMAAYSDANREAGQQVQTSLVEQAVKAALTDGTVKVDVSVTGGK